MPDGKNGNHFQLSKHNTEKLAHEVVDRISDDALFQAMENEEQRLKEIFRRAKIMAEHAGRKTVREEDVRLVLTYMDSDLP